MVSSISDEWIVSRRGVKNDVDPYVPYAFLIEKEYTHTGKVEDVITIFLTNKECPFKCLMCDLWKNTTDEAVPVGAIPSQIKYALDRLPKAKHLKLYNSGNFFDSKAIPPADYEVITALVSEFETLIVECHPKLINQKVIDFNNSISPELQIAMGLETVHPEILRALNKKMTLDDFRNAAIFLNNHQIKIRTFILLGLPLLSKAESSLWAKKAIDFAFEVEVECCAVIPTRTGNGAMDYLNDQGNFDEPDIKTLVDVVEYGVGLAKGRVFGDTWDLEKFIKPNDGFEDSKLRLEELNFTQKV